MAASDLRYVRETLPNQLRMLAGQVEEIQFTLDTRQSRTFRNATDDFPRKLAELRRYLERACGEFPKANIVEVDYSPARLAEVAEIFVGGAFVPKKAYDGSAFYAYLYGMLRARCDYIFHIDSDMLFGGGSQRWVAEAVELLEKDRSVLACMPLPGPPRADGKLTRQLESRRCEGERLAYSFSTITTRVFILDRRRLLSGEFRIPLVRPLRHHLVQSALFNTPPYKLLEGCLSALKSARGLRCIGFLGAEPGLWSLHPPHRSERFFAELPDLVRRIEANDIPADQRGDFDLNDSMIDWSDARAQATGLPKLQRHLRLAANGLSERVFGEPAK
jgi:hypothetical protein